MYEVFFRPLLLLALLASIAWVVFFGIRLIVEVVFYTESTKSIQEQSKRKAFVEELINFLLTCTDEQAEARWNEVIDFVGGLSGNEQDEVKWMMFSRNDNGGSAGRLRNKVMSMCSMDIH